MNHSFSTAVASTLALGFKAVKYQAFMGTGYFGAIQNAVTNGQASTGVISDSTEEEQFH